jgi:hypothetical protein
MPALEELAALLAAEDDLPAGVVRAPAAGAEARLGALAAAGPRASGREREYALLVEAIREGHDLHYAGRGRVVVPADPDLALLAGDFLYALGLSRLAALEDLHAVAELADVIAGAAAAHAGGRPEIAEAVWVAGAAAVGHGVLPGHAEAKAAARRGDPGAGEALAAVARQADGGGLAGRRAPVPNG